MFFECADLLLLKPDMNREKRNNLQIEDCFDQNLERYKKNITLSLLTVSGCLQSGRKKGESKQEGLFHARLNVLNSKDELLFSNNHRLF